MRYRVDRAATRPLLPLANEKVDVDDKFERYRRRKMYSAIAVFVVGTLLLAISWWFGSALMRASRIERSPDHPTEASFMTGEGTDTLPFPSLYEPATLFLSVIVPAYNEEDRMAEGVGAMLTYLTQRQSRAPDFTWEIIIVDDGSKDGSAAMAMQYTREYGHARVRLCKLYKNVGKGGAVRKGMMRARGRFLLMADADGATTFEDVENVLQAMGAAPSQFDGSPLLADVGIGSRSGVQRSALRAFLHSGFTLGMSLLMGVKDISDTQCGFKMFSRHAARQLFPVLHIERWAFDVELVYLAARRQLRMVEVPVRWHEVGGSKVHLLKDAFNMAKDVTIIRLCYLLGWWADTAPAATGAARAAAGAAAGAGLADSEAAGGWPSQPPEETGFR